MIRNRSRLEIIPIRCLQDNYSYILANRATSKAILVDAVQPDRILPVLQANHLQPLALLTTHHHSDHAGGNQRWTEMFPGISIYGGDRRIQSITNLVKDGELLDICGTPINCIHTPGHTRGHICYYLTKERAVFTGDTLFLAGCGRLFEGTAADMYRSLRDKLARLPDETAVYCGHEYTKNNLEFAKTIEPDNEDILQCLERLRTVDMSIPGSIGMEKRINPFMRTHLPATKARFGTAVDDDEVEILAKIRHLKDNF